MTRTATSPIVLHSPAAFRRHMLQFLGVAVGLLLAFLGVGIVGYHLIVGLGWMDSLLNASMILAGMGPVDPMPDDGAKLFASLYAIVSGAVYPALTALVLYPIVHRMMKILHLQALNTASEADEDET